MWIGNQVFEAFGSIGGSVTRTPFSLKTLSAVVLACSVGWLISIIPAPAALNANGAQFLATLAIGVILWATNAFDEYVVALMLLASWVLLEIAPASVALGGFSHPSWFFVIAALGLGAAVAKSGLLRRLAVRILRRISLTAYKTHTFLLFACGLLLTPLLPTGKARVMVALPISQAMAEATGFPNRSHGSAALALSAMLGFSQMSFVFLTGAESCLLGWNLLPEKVKSEFGWLAWFIAAFPAALFIFIFMVCSIHLLFPLSSQERHDVESRAKQFQAESSGPFSDTEWIALIILLATVAGWITVPLHGIGETWIALVGLLAFLATGVLDKKSFKNDVDWTLILFFGIVNSMAMVSRHLEVDRWLVQIMEPVLGSVTSGPATFLITVVMMVFCARLFLRKAAVALILPLLIIPYAQEIGIHPGIVLITILAAGECFLLSYQDSPYQISYTSTNGRAFTHCQARKVLALKFVATALAVPLSVPYWRMLGLIQ